MRVRLTLKFTRVAIPFFMLSCTISVLAQSAKPIVIGATKGVDGSNCDTTKANFDLIAQTAADKGTIIIIARLGHGESSRELIRRRLRNLQEFMYFTRGVSKERTVLAEGERTNGLGLVEVYLKGELFMIFRMKRNRDFLTNCQP
jgi:hypothetical protein